MREWDRHRRPKPSRTAACVPLNPKVPGLLRRAVAAEAIAEGVTFQDWVTAAIVEELERRRTLDP